MSTQLWNESIDLASHGASSRPFNLDRGDRGIFMDFTPQQRTGRALDKHTPDKSALAVQAAPCAIVSEGSQPIEGTVANAKGQGHTHALKGVFFNLPPHLEV